MLQRASQRWAAAVLLGAALPGCVTTPLDDEFDSGGGAMEQGTVVIPLGHDELSDDERVLANFYDNLLRGMQDAYFDRDLGALQNQLAAYDKPNAPDWARERLGTFATLTDGLAFELHCQERARLELVGGAAAIGAPLQYTLMLPALSGREVGLGSEDDDRRFSIGVVFRVEDRDVVGGIRTSDSYNQLVRLPERYALVDGAPLRLPMELQMPPGSAVVRQVRVSVELLPGFVTVDGKTAPLRRTRLCERSVELYPQGIEAVRERPLSTLREAMRLGDPAHFPHVFLAAWFMPDDSRQAAMAQLISWVRLGRGDQARVAMAALQRLSGEEFAVGDRRAWLEWWRDRK